MWVPIGFFRVTHSISNPLFRKFRAIPLQSHCDIVISCRLVRSRNIIGHWNKKLYYDTLPYAS